MKTYQLLPIVTLLLLLTTCCKDEPEGCTEDTSLQELYDWFYFEEGTYWIYEEENSGAIDTVTVWDAAKGTSSGGFDTFFCFTYSSYFDYDVRYRFNDSFSRWCAIGNCTCKRVDRSKARPGDFVGADYIFHSPVFVGNWAYLDEGATVTVTEKIDALMLAGTTFTDVHIHHATEDDSEADNEVFYNVTKNFGIIRKDIIETDQVWKLIDYQIIQ